MSATSSGRSRSSSGTAASIWRGAGALTVIEAGLWTPARLVIIRFPDAAAAKAFADDPDYQPLKAIRQGAARCTLAIVEGV